MSEPASGKRAWPQASTWRGRHDPWKAAFFGLAAAALVAGVGWALLGSSFLVVRTVRTTGSALPSATVLRAAGIKLGTPLIRVDTGAAARRVERIRQVQSARVTLSWPDAVVIWTKSRTAVFAVPAQPRLRPDGLLRRRSSLGVFRAAPARRAEVAWRAGGIAAP